MHYRIFVVVFSCLFGLVISKSQQPSPQEPNVIFDGNKAFSQEELRNAADECFRKLPNSRHNEPNVLEYCLRRVKFYLNSKGYLQAVVSPPREDNIEGARILVIPIEEGLRYRLGEIRITGSKVFSPAQLIEMSPLKSGDIVDGDALADWLFERVKKAYANLGYIQYAGEPEPHFRETSDESSEGVVDFTVTIDEGEAFVVSSIKFEGNGNIPLRHLQKEMQVRPGAVYSRERFEESIRRLNQLALFEPIVPDRDVDCQAGNKTAQLAITIRLKKRLQ